MMWVGLVVFFIFFNGRKYVLVGVYGRKVVCSNLNSFFGLLSKILIYIYCGVLLLIYIVVFISNKMIIFCMLLNGVI